MLAQSVEWQALVDTLLALAEQCGAANASVIDAWGHLWCRARALSASETQAVLTLARTALDTAPKPLTRGGKLRAFAPDRSWYAESFGVYVVLMTFETAPQELAMRRHVGAALQEIEQWTLALPPPQGPGANEGAQRMR